MFGSLGVPELLLIFFVVLIVFGPRKLPEIGRTLGKALGEFRKATDDLKNTIEREVRLEELKSIKTASMESFATPIEAVSRSTPSMMVADTTVSETSPATEPTGESSGLQAGEVAEPSDTPPTAITSPPDDEPAAESAPARRLEDSIT